MASNVQELRPKQADTEKITINLGYVDLGHVDLMSTSVWQFILVHFAIGLSSSATFGPLMAEASHWFDRYRGLAVAIAASGNYIGGTLWPPLVNYGMVLLSIEDSVDSQGRTSSRCFV